MTGLSDAEREALLTPCACGHTLNDHGDLAGCWVCGDDESVADDELCRVSCESLIVAAVGRIVAARVAAARADERERAARAVEARRDAEHIGSGFVPFGGGPPRWIGDAFYDMAASVIRAQGQNAPQRPLSAPLSPEQPPQVPVDPDAGDWACTCGEWHPPTQTACERGEQITTVGEGWL